MQLEITDVIEPEAGNCVSIHYNRIDFTDIKHVLPFYFQYYGNALDVF